MLAYDMNEILSIVPDAVGLVKEASLNEEFPLDNADSVCASALRAGYLTKVAGKQVPYSTQESIEKAVQAYGLEQSLKPLHDRMTKYASALAAERHYDKKASLELSEDVLASGFGYGCDLIKQANYAASLVDRYGDSNYQEVTLRYSGSLPLSEPLLFEALEKRAFVTKNSDYGVIKDSIASYTVDALNAESREKRASLAQFIATLDFKCGYHGDIYKDAFVKEAACKVRLKTKEVSWESIQKLGKGHIKDLVGKDVADALTGDYANDKAVIEALPLDERGVIERFV